MRSLVSDLIPEYNKKLQFFFKETLAYVMNPPFFYPLTTSPCVYH